jgi:hypothetical protein
MPGSEGEQDMIVNVVLRLQVDTSRESIRVAEWIGEEVRDFARLTLGVVKAQVIEVEEVTPNASV